MTKKLIQKVKNALRKSSLKPQRYEISVNGSTAKAVNKVKSQEKAKNISIEALKARA